MGWVVEEPEEELDEMGWTEGVIRRPSGRVGASSTTRREMNVKDIRLSLARRAGINCSPEVSNHMLCSEKSPDIFLWGADGNANCLIDVITSDPTIPNVCPRGVIQTGAAAEVAALSTVRSVLGQRKLRLRGKPSIPSLLRLAVP